MDTTMVGTTQGLIITLLMMIVIMFQVRRFFCTPHLRMNCYRGARQRCATDTVRRCADGGSR